MLTGILGILKAGGAYVPIDTDFPQDRITYMLEDTKATVVVTSSTVSHQLPPGADITIIEVDEEKATLRRQPTTSPATKQEAQSLAYVIYTSGSTGKPKGVEISHSNIADYVYGLEERIRLSESKSFALVSSIATDLGNTVLYGSLITGGTLHVFSKETVSHIEAIHEYFNQNEIDCLKIVPSHWKALMMDDQPLLPRKQLIFGGEALQRTVVETIQATKTNCRIINHYGPTETTIGKLVHEVDKTRGVQVHDPYRQAVFEYEHLCAEQRAEPMPDRGTGTALHRRRRISQRLFKQSRADERKSSLQAPKDKRTAICHGRQGTIPK